MFKRNKVLVMALLLVLSLGIVNATTFAQSSDTEVGYVNLQEVYQAHPKVEKAHQELQQEFQKIQQDFQSELAGIDREKEQDKLQEIQEKFQQKAETIRMNKTEGLMQVVRKELDKVREELGLDIIVNEESVLSGGRDITEEVMNHFENL